MLPILESLTKNGVKNLQRGRSPSVIVLAPTRELAKQVSHDDLQVFSSLDFCFGLFCIILVRKRLSLAPMVQEVIACCNLCLFFLPVPGTEICQH